MKSILVVDDADTVSFLKTLLQQQGHEILTAQEAAKRWK
jgi:CheY-like chemotaxis protein